MRSRLERRLGSGATGGTCRPATLRPGSTLGGLGTGAGIGSEAERVMGDAIGVDGSEGRGTREGPGGRSVFTGGEADAPTEPVGLGVYGIDRRGTRDVC